MDASLAQALDVLGEFSWVLLGLVALHAAVQVRDASRESRPRSSRCRVDVVDLESMRWTSRRFDKSLISFRPSFPSVHRASSPALRQSDAKYTFFSSDEILIDMIFVEITLKPLIFVETIHLHDYRWLDVLLT